MRARTHRSTFLSALAAAALLGGCGSGLYDATGVPAIDGGGGNACNPGQNACGGVCYENNDLAHCGPSCTDCSGVSVYPGGNPGTAPTGGQLACLGTGAATACSYTCGDGLLKCASGCCGATAVAAAEGSTCALLSSAEVACWGANDAGQVGDGATATAQTTPKLVALGSGASAVATGGSHACAVVANGAVKCWGKNDQGQVTGTSSSSPVLTPTEVPGVSGATAVAAGAAHTCAIVAGDAVRCWGGITPAQPILSGARSLSAGKNHACAVVGAAVQCWGSNASNQLGATASNGIATPIGSGITAAGSVAAGGDQTCAATGTSRLTTPDDSLRCWGNSIGNAQADVNGWFLSSPQTTPKIPLKSNGDATIRFSVDRLAVGGHHACVRNELGLVECLGANDRDQLGNSCAAGETATVGIPAVAALAAGASHTCAALTDGRLRCWGDNDVGQLGNGTTVSPGLAQVVAPLGQ